MEYKFSVDTPNDIDLQTALKDIPDCMKAIADYVNNHDVTTQSIGIRSPSGIKVKMKPIH